MQRYCPFLSCQAPDAIDCDVRAWPALPLTIALLATLARTHVGSSAVHFGLACTRSLHLLQVELGELF